MKQKCTTEKLESCNRVLGELKLGNTIIHIKPLLSSITDLHNIIIKNEIGVLYVDF